MAALRDELAQSPSMGLSIAPLLHHRLLASLSVTHHTLFREETRWPGYYYRGDHMKLDDANWHCFTLSRYDRNTGKFAMEKAPVYHIID